MRHTLPLAPQFYVTAPQVCPYLPDRIERKLFTSIQPTEGNIKKNLDKVEYFKKIVKPTNEESSRHKIFLKKEVKKNYFY